MLTAPVQSLRRMNPQRRNQRCHACQTRRSRARSPICPCWRRARRARRAQRARNDHRTGNRDQCQMATLHRLFALCLAEFEARTRHDCKVSTNLPSKNELIAIKGRNYTHPRAHAHTPARHADTRARAHTHKVDVVVENIFFSRHFRRDLNSQKMISLQLKNERKVTSK